jgi:hypothetical protein
MIVDRSAAALSSRRRHDLIDQPIVRCFERIDKSNSRQFKAVLQVLGDQMTYADPLCRRPYHRIPERQPIILYRIERSRKIIILGALYR